MSYASGMAIGLTIGQQLLNFFMQDKSSDKGFNFSDLGKEINYINKEIEDQSVRLAHAIQGRRRYYVNALKKNAKLAKLVSEKLRELPGVKQVVTNINTGSLLIIYTATEHFIDNVFDQLKKRVFSVGSKIVELGTDASSFFRSSIVTVVRDVNKWIKTQTQNVLDLKIVIAAVFIIRGIRKVLMGQRANGPQLLWWAYSLLKGID